MRCWNVWVWKRSFAAGAADQINRPNAFRFVRPSRTGFQNRGRPGRRWSLGQRPCRAAVPPRGSILAWAWRCRGLNLEYPDTGGKLANTRDRGQRATRLPRFLPDQPLRIPGCRNR